MKPADPLSADYDDAEDRRLARAAVDDSDTQALAALLERHRPFIFNVAARMVLNIEDAEDVTQEVLLKLVTNLAAFRGDSGLRTWIYRITFNHVLKMKQRRREILITGFDRFGSALEAIPSHEPGPEESVVSREAREEARITCTTAMLLCLNREQRLAWILGRVFAIDHNLGAELLEISAAAFRKRLSRADRDLKAFMDARCGLVDPNNPCRCAKKTRGFIEAGWVDPQRLQFSRHRTRTVRELAGARADRLGEASQRYASLYHEQPAYTPDGPAPEEWLRNLLGSREMRELFELGS